MQEKCKTLWNTVGAIVFNLTKVHVLENHLELVLSFFKDRLTMVVRRYCRNLPLHVVEAEGADLQTIAQLELIETIKSWDSMNNEEVWPLAQVRIFGAMKDHIRYLTKSDPTRVYEWVVDQAKNYIDYKKKDTHIEQYDLKDQLRFALKQLSEREKYIVYAHTKCDLTFKVIGKKIDLSESQVSRVYKKAMDKMRRTLKEDS